MMHTNPQAKLTTQNTNDNKAQQWQATILILPLTTTK